MGGNQTFKKDPLKLFNEQIKFCDTCGKLRSEIAVEKLPKESEVMEQLIEKGSRLMYCKHCEEY